MIDFLYDLCYMLPLGLVAILSFFTYSETQELSLTGCIAGAVTIIFIRALRHAGRKERFLIGGIVTVALAALLWALGKEKRAEMLVKYSFLLWIIIICIVCIFIGRLSETYLWTKLAVAAALIGNAVYFMIYKITVSRCLVAGTSLVLMIYLASVIQKCWKKSGYTDIKTHISLLTPVMLIVFILVCLMPAPDETFDWSFARSIWNSIVTEYKRVSGIFAGGDDDYSFTGFSSDVAFNGRISKNDKETMLIRTESKTVDRLYLGGAVFEDFYPEGWDSDIEADNCRLFDLLETRGAIIKYSGGYERDYIHEDIITVESLQTRSATVFAPTKINLESSKTVLPEYRETAKGIVTAGKIRYGDTYSLDSFSLNYANEELIRLIDDAEPLTEDEWNELLRKASVSDREACSFSKYQAYKASIYDTYRTTSGLSQEMSEFVGRLTNGIEGDFERVKAISDYLQTMEYSSNPGEIPDYVKDASGYLDYFILDSNQGYCVHYATALVLLARECGYPARYVQGYYVAKDRDEAETMVTSASAHSWAEIYFDNFGWVVFEATPGFSVSAGWNVEKYIKPVSQTGYVQHNQNNEQPEEESDSDINEKEEVKRSFPFKLLVIPILTASFFGALYILANRLISAYKYRNMNNDEKLRFLTGRNLRILKLMGYPISDGETIDEFKTRVGEKSDGEIASFEYIEIYEKLLYSDYTVTDRDVEIAVLDYETLKRAIRRSGVRYYFYFL